MNESLKWLKEAKQKTDYSFKHWLRLRAEYFFKLNRRLNTRSDQIYETSLLFCSVVVWCVCVFNPFGTGVSQLAGVCNMKQMDYMCVCRPVFSGLSSLQPSRNHITRIFVDVILSLAAYLKTFTLKSSLNRLLPSKR